MSSDMSLIGLLIKAREGGKRRTRSQETQYLVIAPLYRTSFEKSGHQHGLWDVSTDQPILVEK